MFNTAYKTREQINLTTTISADPLIPDHVLIFRTQVSHIFLEE